MSTKQGNIKDRSGNIIVPNSTSAAILDVEKSQALSQTLLDTPDKSVLGYNTFSTASAYSVGDIVYYKSKLYKFTASKSAGAWDNTKVEQTSISGGSDARITALETQNGNSALTTTAQTLSGAVNELDADNTSATGRLTALETQNGNTSLPTTAQTLSGAIAELDGDVSDLSEEVDNKASADGYYAQMSVGLAENLISPDGVNNTTPYVLRPTGGTDDVGSGNAKINKIKGNSIVWNQLVGDDTTSVTLLSGRKYLTIIITTVEEVTTKTESIVTGDGTSLSVTGGTDMVIDLTNMFGSDSNAAAALGVADLTSANHATAIANFKKLFPKNYYNTNAGTILNNKVNKVRSVGFNLYNNGTATVIGGEACIINDATGITITDADGNTITPDDDGVFTPTKSGELTITGGTSTTCICLKHSLTGKSDVVYEDYWKVDRGLINGDTRIRVKGTTNAWETASKIFNSGTAESPVYSGIRSAGSVSDEVGAIVNGKFTEITKNVGVVDMGTLAWLRWLSTNLYYANLSGLKIEQVNQGISPIYNYHTDISQGNKLITYNRLGGAGFVSISDSNGIGGLSGVMLNYALQTPVVYEIHPDDQPTATYREDDWGTEMAMVGDDPAYAVSSNVPITAPLGNETFYASNLKDKLRTIGQKSNDKYCVSNESLSGLITALNSALTSIGTISKSWDDTNKKWTFTFTANA